MPHYKTIDISSCFFSPYLTFYWLKIKIFYYFDNVLLHFWAPFYACLLSFKQRRFEFEIILKK